MKTDNQGKGVAKKCHDGGEGTRKDLSPEGAGKSGCDNMQEEETNISFTLEFTGTPKVCAASGVSCVAA